MTEMHLLPRIYVASDLSTGGVVNLSVDQAHYLIRVLRAEIGAKVRFFNGRDGEWLGILTRFGKRDAELTLDKPLRSQIPEPDIRLLCAPIKKAHFEYMIEKATELGVAIIQPILTARTQIREVNIDRCLAIATESAEQSERLAIPVIHNALSLSKVVAEWAPDCRPIICAEWGESIQVQKAFSTLPKHQKTSILVGPEGGFTAEEFDLLRTLPHALFVRLGPRILRADTAALAALTCWQAACGDWSEKMDTFRRTS